MSKNFSFTALEGRLTRDPEIKTTQSMKKIASFSLAVSSGRKKPDGKDIAYFFDCVAWEKTADLVEKYIKKGSRILASGEPTQDTWQDKETGKNRSKFVLNVKAVTFLDAKREDAGNQSPAVNQQPAGDADFPAIGDEPPQEELAF